jgi:hypothetical protein
MNYASDLVPTLRVGMSCGPFTEGRGASGLHSHAERGNEIKYTKRKELFQPCQKTVKLPVN